MKDPTHFTAKTAFDTDALQFCRLVAKILLRTAREQKEGSAETPVPNTFMDAALIQDHLLPQE